MLPPLRPGVGKSSLERKGRERARRRTRSVLQIEPLESRRLLTARIWTGAVSSLWSNSGNWQGGTAPVAGDTLIFPALASNLMNSNDFAADTSFAGISIEASGYHLQGNAVSLAGSLTTTHVSGTAIVELELTLASDQTFSVDAGGTFLQSGAVAGVGTGLTKTGEGTLTLSGTNTFTGELQVDGGVVNAQNGSAIADAARVDVAADGTFNLADAEAIGSLAGDGTVTLGSYTLTIGDDGTSTEFSGVVSGTGGLTKVGAGTLTLSGTNTYSGATLVDAGSLAAASDAALGSTALGTTVTSGASLLFSSASSLAIAEPITAAGLGSASGGALRAAAGTATLSGSITMTANLYLGAGDGAALEISGVIDDDASSFSLSTIGGTSGRVVLSGANLFDGGVTAASGYLRVAADDALGDPTSSTTATIQSGATLELTGGISLPSTKSLALVGLPVSNTSKVMNVLGDNAIAGDVSLADNNQAFAVASGWVLTLSGDVSGSVDYDKNDAGTLIVSGTTSHTGKINVGDGTLLISGDVSASSSIFADGLLGGDGAMPEVTISAIGTLAPTRSATVPTAGDASLSTGAKYRVVIGGTTAGAGYTQLIVDGLDLNADSGEGATLEVSLDSFAPSAGSTFKILDASSAIVGTFQDLPEGSVFSVGSSRFRISYTGGDVVLTALGTPTVSPTSPANPSVYGQGVAFSVTVSGSGVTPTGTATLVVGGTPIEAVELVSGSATFSSIASLAPGSYSVVVEYSGDAAYEAGSASLTQTVNQASTTVTVVAAPTPSVYGQSVTFTATVAPVSPGAGTPTGTVTFTIGSTPYAATLSGGVATLTTSSLAVGSTTVTATYNGDANYTSSTGTATQTVNQATTTTTLVAVPAAPFYGQVATFTATVAAVGPGAGTPTGTVTFTLGSTSQTVALVGGAASWTTSALSVGSNGVTATYNADANYAGSTGSTTVTQIPGPTTTTVVGSPNPSTYGQSVTFTAVVTPIAPGGGVPIGTVTFIAGSSSMIAVLVGGVATWTTSALAVGTHAVTAVFTGGATHLASVGATAQTVNQADTTVAVVGAPSPSIFGQSVTFTATVAPVASGAGTPTGTVTFVIGSTTATVALVDGVATYATSGLAVGDYGMSATYNGDAIYAGSAGEVDHSVLSGDTTTTVVGAPTPSVYGQSVTFTATVAALAGVPTGAVDFTIGSQTTVVALVDGVATLTVSNLAVGTNTVTATFPGGGVYSASAGTFSQAVARAATAATLVASPNPSTHGQGVTLTATVAATAPGTGVPAGVVAFYADATLLGTAALGAGGVASFVATGLGAGDHSITAVYLGNANFSGATSAAVSQVVRRAASTTSLTSSPISGRFGDPITFTATVSPARTDATVTFFDGVTAIGVGALDASGVATFTIANLSAGSHAISARFDGDLDVQPSLSAPTIVTVTQSESTAGGVDASSGQFYYGEAVVLSITVTAASNGGAAMTGTVAFFDGDVYLGSAPLTSLPGAVGGPIAQTATVSGVAALPVRLSVGDHVIRAVYSGDALYSSAESEAPVSIVVDPATTATSLAVAATPTQLILTARVVATSPGDPALAGTVSFYQGTTLLGTAPLIDGVATLVAPALPPGAYAYSAAFADAGGNATGSVETTLASTEGPRVVGLSRLGFHAQPTVLVLTFDSPLDPARAEDLANYRIVDSRGRAVRLASATYDPIAGTVTLRPAQRLNLHAAYTLTAVGAAPSGLTGSTMIPLDGSGRNQPGTDFVTRVGWRALNVPGRPPAVTFANGRPTGASTPRGLYIATVVKAILRNTFLVLPGVASGARAFRPFRR
ncbi:beta strand repeat-containing protein [Paludisphaera soli]|uniref:beta strand repeat-containing protein n=1 Tax=Paludisphaera soli TaxID=2712865 RepID=UPI0013E9CBB6|nr:Ig-like domain repeat protein [Paludisphaera soli]